MKIDDFKLCLDFYSTLKDDWGDGGELAPTKAHIDMALLGIKKFVDLDIPDAKPMLLNDGVIGAYWYQGKKYLSIDFEIDGEFTWACYDGDKFGGGIWNLIDPIPSAVIMHLKNGGN